jgi:FAD/FMN-containing dehydrogenase
LLKRDFLGYSRSDEEISLMRGLKNLFDPDQILNPDKLLPLTEA